MNDERLCRTNPITRHIQMNFGSPPACLKTRSICYGAGSRDIEIPNVLRLYLGEREERCAGTEFAISQTKIVETNIDDLNPQIYGYVMDRLFAAGAYGVYFSPVFMKKNRPGTKITVMVSSEKVNDVVRIIVEETSTTGVRILDCKSAHIDVSMLTVETEWGGGKGQDC